MPQEHRQGSASVGASVQPEVKLSSRDHAVIGALVGSIEMAIMKPTVFWKSELQQGRFQLARAFNPAYCYRGLPVAVGSLAPVTSIQFVANSAVLRGFGHVASESATDRQRLTAGVLSGFASALAQSPMQLVEINQQNHGGNMFHTARRVVEARGLLGLYTGYPMTAIREGIFVTSYMAVAPLLRRNLKERYPQLADGMAMAASAIVAGGVGSMMSHPADTMKTKLQGGIFPHGLHAAPAQDNTLLQKLAMMRQEKALLPQLYAGFVPRFFRIVCCTFIYGSLKELFESLWTSRLQTACHVTDVVQLTAGFPAAEYLPASSDEEKLRFEANRAMVKKVCPGGQLRLVVNDTFGTAQSTGSFVVAHLQCEQSIA